MKTTNLVQVRRAINGFTSRSTLCDTCGIQSECRRLPTRTCAEYVPTLKFRDMHGTEGRFATFRSPTWAKTIKIGERVRVSDGIVSRLTRVVATYDGTREEMEERFGSVSHLSIGKPFNLAEFRKARQRQIGPRLYQAMTQVSVIILE